MILPGKNRNIYVLVVLLLFSCNTTPVPQPEPESDISEKHKPEITADNINKSFPETENKQHPDNSGVSQTQSPDPLEEVRKLLYAGLIQKARERFREKDAAALESGERHFEWALLRGQLYIQSFKAESAGLADINISRILIDKDDLWIGTWMGGVSRYSIPLNQYTLFDRGEPSLNVKTVNRIASDGNSIIILTYGNLYIYNKRSSEILRINNLPVKEKLQDYLVFNSRSYLATLGYGLWVKADDEWEKVNIPDNFITSLGIYNDRYIIVGTINNGVFLYNTVNGSLLNPTEPDFSRMNITAFDTDSDNIICGTFGSGAFLWNPNTGITERIVPENFDINWILSVLVSGKTVYFATFGNGITAWNMEKNLWDKISVEEGLVSPDVSSLSVAARSDNSSNNEGVLWAGLIGGGFLKIDRGIHGWQ